MSWKSRLFYLSVIAFLSVNLTNEVGAQVAKPVEKPAASESAKQEKDVSEMSFDEIEKDYADRTKAFRAHRRSLPRAEKRLDKTKVPTANDYQARLIEIINEDPGSQVGLDAIDWWIKRGGRAHKMSLILGLVMKNYSKLESIHKYVPYLAFYLPKTESEKYLRELIANSPLPSIRGTASYELHGFLTKQLKGLDGEKAETAKAEIKSLRATIDSEYSDVTTFLGSNLIALMEQGEFAKKLAIGKPIPDIVGTDIAGVDFKFSDYDGKVRVLTFWGHW